MRIQRGGGQGVQTPPPLKNHRNIRFLSNTGPDSIYHFDMKFESCFLDILMFIFAKSQ